MSYILCVVSCRTPTYREPGWLPRFSWLVRLLCHQGVVGLNPVQGKFIFLVFFYTCLLSHPNILKLTSLMMITLIENMPISF